MNAGLAPAWWDRATLAAQTRREEQLRESLQRAIALDPLYWHRAHEEDVWYAFRAGVNQLCEDMKASVQQEYANRLTKFAQLLKLSTDVATQLQSSSRRQLLGMEYEHGLELAEIRRLGDTGKYALVVAARDVIPGRHRSFQQEFLRLLDNEQARVAAELKREEAGLESTSRAVEQEAVAASRRARYRFEETVWTMWKGLGIGCATWFVVGMGILLWSYGPGGQTAENIFNYGSRISFLAVGLVAVLTVVALIRWLSDPGESPDLKRQYDLQRERLEKARTEAATYRTSLEGIRRLVSAA